MVKSESTRDLEKMPEIGGTSILDQPHQGSRRATAEKTVTIEETVTTRTEEGIEMRDGLDTEVIGRRVGALGMTIHLEDMAARLEDMVILRKDFLRLSGARRIRFL